MFKLSVFSFVLGLMMSSSYAQGEQAKKAKYEMYWLAAHGPVEIILSGYKSFSEEVEKKTNGEVSVELDLSLLAHGEPSNEKNNAALKSLIDGEHQIGQVYTSTLLNYNSNFAIFDLPYFFPGHDSATAFFEGKLGEKLLSGLSKNGLVGSAFTYSGGYRILISKAKNKIGSIDDFKDKRISYVGFNGYVVPEYFYSQLGSKPNRFKKQDVGDALDADQVDAYETVYSRAKNLGEVKNNTYAVNETYHNLQVTALVINKKFLDKLPKKYQKIVLDAAKKAARDERAVSIEVGDRSKKELIEKGVEIVKFSAEEEAQIREKFKTLPKELEKQFSSEFLEFIKKSKK